MQDFLNYIEELLNIVCQILMTEPIVYFTGIIVLLAIVALVKRICNM